MSSFQVDKEPIDRFFTNLYIYGEIKKKEHYEQEMANKGIKR